MSDNDMAIGKTIAYANGIPAPVPPYNDPSAGDAIIRTSDGVELHVLRAPMVAVGLDPNGMLSKGRAGADPNIKLTITVQETAAVWEKLLRVCLMHEELPYSLADVVALLEAGRKYGLAGMPTRMRYALAQPALLEKEPVWVFLLASTHRLHDIAAIAARRALDLPTLRHDAFDGLQAVTGVDYYRIMVYRDACGRAAKAVTLPQESDEVLPGWIASNPAYWKPLSMTCVGRCAAESKTLLVTEEEGRPTTIYVRIRNSWVAYLEALGKMLAEQPRPSLASSPELLEPVIASALECAHCAKTIYRGCVAFSRAMEAKIEQAVSEVRLAA